MIYSPNLPKKSAGDIALVIFLNRKAMAMQEEPLDSAPAVK
jgi:hypothetical protein